MTAPAKPVLDAPAETPAGASAPVSGGSACPECLQPFKRAHPRQLFCCDAHKRAWHNRNTVRGARLASLAIAAHSTRNGTRGDKDTGKRARRDAEQLMRQWDIADREEGRMRAIEYIALRNRLGYDQ